MSDTIEGASQPPVGDGARAWLAAAAGLLGATAASSCCIIPLALFGLGVSGAWIGGLTALAPYQPVFLALASVFLGYGHWLSYRASADACASGDACRRPAPKRIVKSVLWLATALVGLAAAWPYLVPFFLTR